MSIRLGLLAILDEGDCYGNQLRLELDRRTGGVRSVNVGQIYQTLDRLQRDKLVTRAEPDGAGYTYFAITAAGSAEVSAWFRSPTGSSARGDLAMKVVLAMTLPGVDARGVIEVERRAAQATAALSQAGSPESRLMAAAVVAAAEAEVRWLDHCEAQLAVVRPYGLSTDTPRRGRPALAPS